MLKIAASDSYSISTARDRFRQRVLVRMRQQQNRLLGMIHRSIGQTRLIVFNQRDVVLAGNVLRRDDDKLVPVDSRPET